MSFLDQFRQQIYPEWATDYVSYQSISQGLEIDNWDDTDELNFQSAIQLEFEKVDLFITKQERDIQANISYFNRFNATTNYNDLFGRLLKLKHYIRSNYQALEELVYQHDEVIVGRKPLWPVFAELNRKYRLDTQRLSPLLIQLPQKVDTIIDDGVHATYWVDQSCVNEVKSILLFHLPVSKTTHYNQTYFDNARFQNYIKNCQYDKDAEMLLFEITRNNNHDSIDVIKKKRRINDDKDEERISITRDQLNDYLQHNDLEPKLQLEFEQSIFSQKDDEIIVFENEITFIKKDQEDDSILQNDDTDDDRYQFPYAVLTIKSTSTSPWLLELLKSKLVYPVPCYSNVLQGISHFWNLELPILPIWWWIHTDDAAGTIMNQQLKIMTGLNQIGYLEKQLNKQNQIEEKGGKGDLKGNRSSASTSSDPQKKKSKTNEEKLSVQTIEDKNIAPTHSNIISIDDAKESSNSVKRRKSSFVQYYDPEKAIPDNQIQICSDYAIQLEDSDEEAKRLKKEKKQKKKAKKLKELMKSTEHTIEPKLFFANERTFIHWLQFSALILTAALTLLNFGDRISTISGATFFGISLILALYAFFRYRYRAHQMSTTPHIRYDDIYGPIGLTVLILGAMALNFALRWEHPSDSSSYLGINNQTQQQNGP